MLTEAAEGPEAQLLREVYSKPTQQLATLFRASDIGRSITSLVEAQRSLSVFADPEEWAQLSVTLPQFHGVVFSPETAAALQYISKSLKAIALADHRAFLPVAEELQGFSRSITLLGRVSKVSQDLEAWKSSIISRMATINVPWASQEHIGLSVTGFARLARLHDVSVGSGPFDPAVSEIIDEELGAPVPFDTEAEPQDREAVKIDAGLNPEIIAFPSDAYPTVLYSAGFQFHIQTATPAISDLGDTSSVLHPQHAALLGQVETHLRQTILSNFQLTGEAGMRQRIPGDLLKKWQERKDKDHSQRGDSYPLIFYSDFMDLENIICRHDNWNNFLR